MKLNKTIILLFACLSTHLLAQDTGVWGTRSNELSPWDVTDKEKYEGVYHFREGDGSNFTLCIDDTIITAQIHFTGYWVEGGYAVEAGIINKSELTIKDEFVTLTNVEIQGNRFYSDQYQGEFVIHKTEKGHLYGIKINNSWNPWIGENKFEFGFKVNLTYDKLLKGDAIVATTRLLNEKELEPLSSDSLQIIRNSIFARYHYEFIEGSKMYTYFNKQSWYWPRYKSVNKYLTEIELKNIELIKRLEQKKQ